ncbi:MAG: sigma-70 family RNA polymerase sigma factor [Christensenellaceae bacterium]|jgi:RNA polymerase sporulation-specific sigma factor|nr:sigma-70 family RNA polymerase sigma factor [Christensenellaceae bacterium]
MKKVSITNVCTADLPNLTAKQSLEMLKQIKSGHPELREAFLLGNSRLVLSMVGRFPQAKVCADDLFQTGMLGLIKATDNFNPDLNVQFSTYAVPMILGEIKRVIRENSALKVGRGVRDIAYRAMLAREKIERERSKEASLAEIAAEIDVPYGEVTAALDAIAEPQSLYDPAYSESQDGMSVCDTIADKSVKDPIEDRALKSAFQKLAPKERLILHLRYFRGLSQTEIAEEYEMSQAQISRLEKDSLKKLRTYIESVN